MSSLRPTGDTAWSYLRMPAHIAPHILMDEISPGVFECVALESLPSRGPTNCADPPNSYRTRDLFTRHPTNHSWWKYLTRLDDRLTLVNGEKVLPLPIEGRVRQSPLVAEAVVFGAGRSVPGMLVFRDEEGGGAGAGEMGEGEFMEAIWGDVEEANSGAESFSRVPRELVVVMPKGTSWPRTDKGTAVRQQVYEVFKGVIDEAYARFEHGEEEAGDGAALLSLGIPELEQWLLERFRVDLGVGLESVDAEVFAAGVDSLQTTRIWSLIRKKLDLGGKALSQNVVYEKGTLRALAKHLYGLRTGEDVGQSDEEELLAMQELVEEYSSFHPHVPGTAPAPAGEVVVSPPTPPSPLPSPSQLTPTPLPAPHRRNRRPRRTPPHHPPLAPRRPPHLRPRPRPRLCHRAIPHPRLPLLARPRARLLLLLNPSKANSRPLLRPQPPKPRPAGRYARDAQEHPHMRHPRRLARQLHAARARLPAARRGAARAAAALPGRADCEARGAVFCEQCVGGGRYGRAAECHGHHGPGRWN